MLEKIVYHTANALRSVAQRLWPEEEAPDFLRDFRLLDTHRMRRFNRVNGEPMRPTMVTVGNLAHWAAETSGSRYVLLLSGTDGRVTIALADPRAGGLTECWAKVDQVRPTGVLVEFTEMRVL